jgi:hypothetical protein
MKSWEVKKSLTILAILCMLSLLVLSLPAQDVTFSITPASGDHGAGDVFDITFKIDTGGNAVISVLVAANIDPKLEVWDKDGGVPSIAYGKGIKVDPAWDSPAPPNTTRQDGNVVTFGAGVTGLTGITGADLTIAVMTLHVKDAAEQGAAPVTFEPSAGDFLNGTFAISTAFTELTSSLVGASYNIGVPVKTRWDFDADAEGWKFSGQIKTLDPPTEAAADGALNMTATNNTNTFGFWYSPTDAINELQADSLYQILFGIKSDQADKSVVPSCRIRWNSSNEKQSDLVMINSKMAGEASPGQTVQDYHIYMRPQGMALDPGITGYLSFDMVNINPNDSADAKLSLDYAEWKRIDISAAGTSTTKATYTFDVDKEGWTSTPQIDTFDQPVFLHDPVNGYLTMQCDDNNNTFGFWQNPHEGGSAIALDNTVLYQLRVKAGAGSGEAPKILQEDPPLMRIRMYDHPSNQMCAMFQSPVWTDYITPAGGKQVTTSDFYAYFHNPLGVGPTLGIAVDIVNLDPEMDPNGLIAIDEVELSTLSIPSF